MGVTEAIDGMARVDRMWQSRPGLMCANWYLQGFLDTDSMPMRDPRKLQSGAGIGRTIRNILRDAEPIYVSAPICQLIAGTYAGLPDYTMTPGDLPCPDGLIWFADPIPLEAPTPEDAAYSITELGYTPKIRAIHFHPWNGKTAAGHHVSGNHDITGCAIAVYMDGMEDRNDPDGVKYCYGIVMPWGESWSNYVSLYREADAQLSVSLRLTGITLATLAFMQQKIAHVGRDTVRNKKAARRLRKDTGKDSATVVTLRRMERAPTATTGEHREITYSVQWLVGADTFGHWRNHWFPSEGRHKPLFIAPYWKGPEDAPVKVGKKIYKVAR